VPLVPVTVTVAPPSVAVLDAASVNVELVPVFGVVGLNAAVTPLGKPVAAKLTPPVNPPVRAIFTVLIPLAPRLTVRLAGLADKVKSTGGGWFTVREIAVV